MNDFKTDYLLVYGTLCRGFPAHNQFQMENYCEYQGVVQVNGQLYDLGHYPGWVLNPNANPVKMELYRIHNDQGKTLLKILDEYEEINWTHPELSEYCRKAIFITHPGSKKQICAWVYEYQLSTVGLTQIQSIKDC